MFLSLLETNIDIDEFIPTSFRIFFNGHFCYVFKFGIIKNVLGIIRHISFYNNDFMMSHPAIVDSVEFYKSLLIGHTFNHDSHFSKAYVPLNVRFGLENQDYNINETGILCCPNDPLISMKYECIPKLKAVLLDISLFVPEKIWAYDKTHRKCCCKNSCTISRCGRMINIYLERDLRVKSFLVSNSLILLFLFIRSNIMNTFRA